MKEVVLINDIAAIASCTLGVSLPVLSVCDCKSYPVPTAVFTSSTRVEGFACTSLSDFLPAYAKHWSTLPLHLAGIMTGCFGDAKGVDAAVQLVRQSKGEDTLVLVDPVMGDDGHLFASSEHLSKIKQLVGLADVICPNFTEFCALTGLDFAACDALSLQEKSALICQKTPLLGVPNVVVTGIRDKDEVVNAVCTDEGIRLYHRLFKNKGVCGTGDMFSSILLAGLLYGKEIGSVVEFAGRWIQDIAAQPVEHPERGLYIGGEKLLAIRSGLLAL